MIQLWMREIRRIVAGVDLNKKLVLRFADDLNEEQLEKLVGEVGFEPTTFGFGDIIL